MFRFKIKNKHINNKWIYFEMQTTDCYWYKREYDKNNKTFDWAGYNGKF